MELDLGPLDPPEPVPAPAIPKFPPVLIDVALVVPDEVPAAAVLDALREGAGPLLDSIQLFDVYSGLAAGRSLAFTLRFRGHQRTLTMDDAIKARDAAIARATELTGAKLRS